MTTTVILLTALMTRGDGLHHDCEKWLMEEENEQIGRLLTLKVERN